MTRSSRSLATANIISQITAVLMLPSWADLTFLPQHSLGLTVENRWTGPSRLYGQVGVRGQQLRHSLTTAVSSYPHAKICL